MPERPRDNRDRTRNDDKPVLIGGYGANYITIVKSSTHTHTHTEQKSLVPHVIGEKLQQTSTFIVVIKNVKER